MRFRIALVILLFVGFETKAQVTDESFINDLIESLAENLPEDFDLSELQDRLTFYHKHPINLNKTNTEELKTLVFLSPLQISNLFEHIQKNGKLLDVLELQSIAEFDVQTIERLLPFVTVNPNELQEKITFKNLRLYSDNDLITRYGRNIEKAKGFTDLPGSKYLGTPDRYLFRYKYNFLNRLSASLLFEKDAGEYFFNGPKQNPFDFQSAHIALNNTGIFKKIVVGDYTLQFGQALTLWSGFAFGKSPDVTSVVKRDVGLKPYTSANEFAFFKGGATTIQVLKNIEFTTFYSFRNHTASINLINGEETVATLNETGYHRTNTEINNKNSINQQSYGGVLAYQSNLLTIGAIGYKTTYSKPFVPANNAYSQFNFTGNNLTNWGTYYNYTFKNFYFFGEGSYSANGGKALVSGALISLSSKVSSVIFYRNIGNEYHSFFNQATTEASDAINEKGIYAGLNINPNSKWALSFYGDYFKFPWLRFRVDAPSEGHEILGQAVYMPNKRFKAILRFKSEKKQQNTDLAVPINYLDDVLRENYRGEINWQLNKSWEFQNRLEFSQFRKANIKEFGYLVYQDASYKPLSSKLTGNVRFAYFNTPSYNSRIYAYEDDVLYSFAFGLYNGRGFRSYINLKYRIAKHFDFWARYAITKYANVSTVGSGLDEIQGSVKSDARVQLRYQF